MATDKISTTGRIRLTLEIDWPHSFGEGAIDRDIYQTVQRECLNILTQTLDKGEVRYRIIGEVEPLMVIYPVKK